MANPSNLYAEKIFAEHPLALWAFDDKVDFVSLINSNDKIMSGWQISSNASFLSSTTQAPYLENTPIIAVEVEDDNEATIVSTATISGASLDSTKNTFNISTYFKGDQDATIKIGYIYGGNYVFEEFEYVAQAVETWALLSKSFDNPGTGSITLKIAITQSVNAAANFYFNNFSVGQWPESFVSKSSGNIVEELSSYVDVDLPGTNFAVPAKAYGLADIDGYYIANSNRLFSYNEGFPMVYGANNVTKIESTNVSNRPSLIIPGFGFLNEKGKYYDLTAEMWIRLNVTSYDSKRIFGPIASSDGLYINGDFLVIRVGNNYGSYFVGEWGRPMLLHFRVSQNTASLLVDGEQAISIEINTEEIDMPKAFSETGKEQDWLGFYSYSNIDLFEIDAVAIYGYQIPEIVAKRRFVYGQGVEFPELSSASLISSSAFIDYRVANYANNFMYPDMARWSQGITDNIVIDAGTIKTPTYSLPIIFFNNSAMTRPDWLNACDARTVKPDNFGSVTFQLANSVAGNGGYFYFDNLNVISSKVAGMYGVFRAPASLPTSSVLFKIINKLNGSSFTASFNNGAILYTLSDDIDSDIVIDPEIIVGPNDLFVAGINFKALNNIYGGRMSRFFGSSKNLKVYIAGQDDLGATTFYGEFYRFGFMTERNLNLIKDFFSEDLSHITINDEDDCEEMVNFTASYTLKPTKYLDRFDFDISINSYWQDYIPLSRIDGAVLNADGEYEKRLSFLQFNANVPIVKNIIGSNYSFDSNKVKLYVTFQYLASKPNVDHRLFTITQPLGTSKTINPTGNWIQTKYEIADDSIIYLPPNVDYKKLALVIHCEIQAESSLAEQIKIKSIQVASQALSDVEPKRIITRFGDGIFGYILRGIYPDYSAKNPISIYKGSTPYLYLTNTSGIKLAGVLNDTSQRGIRYVLNQQASNLYRVGASQILARYYEDTFPTTPQKLLSYRGFVVQAGRRQERIISIYVVSSNPSNTRGRLIALDEKTGLVDPTVYFYLNGSLVKDLHLSPRSWNMIGLQFQVALDINSSIGYVDISGPLLVHGISNYRLTSIQDAQSSILRSWSQVRTMIDKQDNSGTNWGDFLSSNPVITWQSVLYIPTETSFLVDAATPYKIYTGTNKIIVGDNNKFRINKYQYKVYQDIVWQSNIFDAV